MNLFFMLYIFDEMVAWWGMAKFFLFKDLLVNEEFVSFLCSWLLIGKLFIHFPATYFLYLPYDIWLFRPNIIFRFNILINKITGVAD